jgi:hypothetical protein
LRSDLSTLAGSAGATKFGYDKNGKPMLTKEPKLAAKRRQRGEAGRDSNNDRPPPRRGVRQFHRWDKDAGFRAMVAVPKRSRERLLQIFNLDATLLPMTAHGNHRLS